MKTKILLFLLFIFSTISSQELLNGDLEGEIMGFSTLPDHWEKIPHTDINCQAEIAMNATPNLTSIDEPDPDIGLFGYPFSGNTFVTGSHLKVASSITYHEGIMQTVSGFQIGAEYNISFYQSVIPANICNDKSGSWMVILNDSIIGISNESVTNIQYTDPNLIWEFNSINFIAFEEELVIKFIPWDSDGNLMCDNSGNGGLGMGIDKIAIELKTNTKQTFNDSKNLILSPNPTYGNIYLDIKAFEELQEIRILDINGKVAYLKSNFENLDNFEIFFNHPSGIYFIIITVKDGVIGKKFVKL